ncbi:mandelate racemase/muconate lactonizing enzyme family protein [Pseudomonas sp. NPDC086251]|uniref:mandelate racemase/muconate lactonizing enzyme family protein n=1 Tax=Pseudomonas sp. NPDC086251 TaxID=3364431 RepID=UPI003835AA8D
MRIKRVSISLLRIPLRKPFVSCLRRVEYIEDVVIEIETDCGLRGYGAGTPSLRMNGESVDSIISVVKNVLAPTLMGKDVSQLEAILTSMDHSIAGNAAAKASIDIALHDLMAQAAGLPLYRFLGGDNQQITTGISISHNTLDEMVSDAAAAVSNGFTTLKLKLGSAQGIEDDLRRVREIRRSVGESIEIGVDANQAWRENDALKFAEQVDASGMNLSFIEQPVLFTERSCLGRVTDASRIPVLADESCSSLLDAADLAKHGIVDGLAIKLMKLGGIRAARSAYDLARLHARICAATCLMESPIAIAAMASFCSGRHFRFIDLDAMALITHNPVIGGATMSMNTLLLSDQPGLGIQRIEGLEPLLSIS